MKNTTLFNAMRTIEAYERERMGTHESDVIPVLYERYVANESLYMTKYDHELKRISSQVDQLVGQGSELFEILGDLEGNATQAGFWAGFLAGEAYARFLQKQEATRIAG